MVAAVAAAAILILGLAIYSWSSAARAKLEFQLARMRANEQPTTTAELSKFYTIPAGAEDSTQLWIDATAPFDSTAFSQAVIDLPIIGADGPNEIPLPPSPWSQQQQVEQLLSDYAESMQKIHQATAQGGYARFDRDFDQGIEMLLPHVQNVRNASRMLKLEAYVHAHQQDSAACFKSLQAMFTVGRAVENDPLLVSCLVMFALDGMAVKATCELLPYLTWTDDQLTQLQQLTRRTDYLAAVCGSLIGEQVIAIRTFETLTPSEVRGNDRPGTFIFRPEDQAKTLELIGDCIEATEGSWPDMLDAAEASVTELQSISSKPLNRLRYMMTCLLFPALEAVAQAGARSESYAKLADVLVAAQRFKLANTAYPKSVDELVPKFLPSVPLDPHNGAAVHYELRDGYPVAWCVGVDMVDDGGVGMDAAQPDVVLTLAPAASE